MFTTFDLQMRLRNSILRRLYLQATLYLAIHSQKAAGSCKFTFSPPNKELIIFCHNPAFESGPLLRATYTTVWKGDSLGQAINQGSFNTGDLLLL